MGMVRKPQNETTSFFDTTVTHTLHHLMAPPPDGDISLAFFLRGFVLKFHTHPCLCVQLYIYMYFSDLWSFLISHFMMGNFKKALAKVKLVIHT